jgi:hypothetical protein
MLTVVLIVVFSIGVSAAVGTYQHNHQGDDTNYKNLADPANLNNNSMIALSILCILSDSNRESSFQNLKTSFPCWNR